MNQISKGVILITAVSFLTMGTVSVFSEPQSRGYTVTVYKNRFCGCCNKWVDHLKNNGFKVNAFNTSDLSEIKANHGVPDKLASCHTAFVEGYVVEGHVPADVIQRLLKEKPKVLGIAVPGMPIGSPGMEGSYSEHYDILTFDRNGKIEVYTSR
jgi:hypothetical protein